MNNFDLNDTCSALTDSEITRDSFVTRDHHDLDFTPLVQYHIHLEPNFVANYQRPYRLTPEKGRFATSIAIFIELF